MKQTANLYIITGKGGVGKTTISLALTKYLINQGLDARFAFFKNSSLLEGDKNISLAENCAHILGIKTLPLALEDCAQKYIAKKLHSNIVGKAVVKTPFFRALINMIPGFNYLIYMGQILQMIQDSNKEMIVVLDSPSSGHALTMLEATSNFQEIFRSGVIFEDTKKMLQLVNKEGFSKIHIISTPNQLSVSEGQELSEDIAKLSQIEIKMWLNNALKDVLSDNTDKTPEFLRKKLQIEDQVAKNYKPESILPHVLDNSMEEVVKDLLPHMENLV